jgi:hypothetical protein
MTSLGVPADLQDGGMLRDGVTHIGHKAGHQCLLEHRVPVHVSQVGCTLKVAEAGQAALRVLSQELWSEGKGATLNHASR